MGKNNLPLNQEFTLELSKMLSGQTTADIVVSVADDSHLPYVETILQTIADAAAVRGTGIAKRSPEYISMKIREGKAIIALVGSEFAGFCYMVCGSRRSLRPVHVAPA